MGNNVYELLPCQANLLQILGFVNKPSNTILEHHDAREITEQADSMIIKCINSFEYFFLSSGTTFKKVYVIISSTLNLFEIKEIKI